MDGWPLDEGGFALDGDVDGSIDILSISPLKRSRSLSCCPPALAALSFSI
jgi:hypothetical protein